MTDITPRLCRAARVLIGWEQTDLARLAQVSEQTIRNFELERRTPHERNRVKILGAFADAGLRFVIEPAGQGMYRSAVDS